MGGGGEEATTQSGETRAAWGVSGERATPSPRQRNPEESSLSTCQRWEAVQPSEAKAIRMLQRQVPGLNLNPHLCRTWESE